MVCNMVCSLSEAVPTAGATKRQSVTQGCHCVTSRSPEGRLLWLSLGHNVSLSSLKGMDYSMAVPCFWRVTERPMKDFSPVGVQRSNPTGRHRSRFSCKVLESSTRPKGPAPQKRKTHLTGAASRRRLFHVLVSPDKHDADTPVRFCSPGCIRQSALGHPDTTIEGGELCDVKKENNPRPRTEEADCPKTKSGFDTTSVGTKGWNEFPTDFTL